MTETPDKPSTPTDADPAKPEGEADRADALIDAVVSDTKPAETSDPSPTPAQPASAGGKKNAKKKTKPEPTTRWGKLWVGWIKPIGTVFIIVALLRSTIIDWNDVPTGSMEPTILVGDRILVNKMAYALQVPLSGPKIGVPFTPLQWDNPLDPLPAWHWGNPRRGDIVTFWNPVTGVRMVKRIVAEPGDTIELRGGVMTITPKDGTPTTATYVDVTPAPPYNISIVGQDKKGDDIRAEVEHREETLLGETRTAQHIPERWTEDWQLYRFADGREAIAVDGRVTTPQGQVPIDAVLAQAGTPTLHLAIRDGEPFIGGESVSFNDFATAFLRPLAALGDVEIAGGHTLGVEGYTWQIDGEPANSEQVLMLQIGADQDQLSDDAARLFRAHNTLRPGLMTSSFGPVTLGDDEYFMIGDNRNNSVDSRYFGPIQRSEITGEAIAIPVSFNGRIRDLSPRWSRWFHGLD